MRVLLVIPFYRGDRGMVERLGKWMTALSSGKKICDQVLFSATANANVKGIGDNFKGLFSDMKAIQQTFGPNLNHGENPWPKACNLQFLHTAKHVHDHYPDINAFYYFEPDNLPLTPDWFDCVVSDYETQGKPFWGAEVKAKGSHMLGTGIYPRDAWERIAKYAEIEKNQPSEPWDALTYAEVTPHCHFTKLVQHLHSSRGFRVDATAVHRTPLDPEVKRRPVVICPDAVIFHGCKDSSLRLLVAQKLRLPQTDTLTFAHSGDLGDMIYALPSIKQKGGGILKISESMPGREKMTPERIAAIQPLLEKQPYIKGVEKHSGEYVDFDLRPFRMLHKQNGNLVKSHADWIGCPTTVGDEVWLENIAPRKVSRYVINRTARYLNELFPWDKIASTKPDACFIGTVEEYDEFSEVWNTSRVDTLTLLDAASVIAGSYKFIGNQSACFAIAEGMKHPRIQETCPEATDCIFDSDTGTYCLDGELDMSEFYDSSLKDDFEEILKNPKFIKCVRQLVREIIEEELK